MDELTNLVNDIRNPLDGISSTTWWVVLIGVAVLWFGMRNRV